MKFEEYWENTKVRNYLEDEELVKVIAEGAWNRAILEVVMLLQDYGTAVAGVKGVETSSQFYDDLAEYIKRDLSSY